MKKLLLVLITALTTLLSIHAVFDPYATQTLSGFIDDVVFLYVSPFSYENIEYNGYYGIDLDYSDTSNGHRFNIMPTETPKTVPGLQIGTFRILATFVTSNKQAHMKISHTNLVHTDGTTMIDYELSVQYSMSDGTSLHSPDPSYALSGEQLDISVATPIASVLEGNLYFRLANGSSVTKVGQYTSNVTIILEVQ